MMLLAFAVLGYYWYRMPPIIPQKVLHFGVACLGSFTCILFFARMDDILNFKIFNKLGTMTLGIYAIHPTLIWVLNKLLPMGVRELNKTLGGFMASFIMVLLLTLAIRYTLRLSKVTSLLFLGENRFRE